ncbi:MAG: hypothetical protein J6W64_07255 [Bacilli bacterium]|nr:hypothetical protein [Bacilli bacterium]
MEDYEIRVNGNVVAICIKDVVRLFTDALINVLGDEFEISVKKRPVMKSEEPIEGENN